MISREQVEDLQPGDVVELRDRDWPEGTVFRGPLWVSGGELRVGGISVVRWPIKAWAPYSHHSRTLTVVSRAPRPMYVNHPRTKPVSGDVARDEDDDATTDSYVYLTHVPQDAPGWRTQYGRYVDRDHMPDRLRLLVDGTTGQVVP